MPYLYSHLDERNIGWFNNDNNCATLKTIALKVGTLRGLKPFQMDFNYPITAIAGENGSGKSSVLSMAACAFHNKLNGYKLKDRANSYYTFSDFFIQSSDEIPPQGILIRYQIRYNRWHRKDDGLAWQTRSKREGGRWSNYDSRVNRNVVYFGIQRVVPHYERSAHKSYRGRFLVGALDDVHKNRICQIASRIFSKTYDEFNLYTHSKYTLPIVTTGDFCYSGFNMGAGECTIFEILTALFEAGGSALLIIDEIEIGLHESAQRKLIEELKILCDENHCQIICSTHSHVVLETLPPEARIYIETGNNRTKTTPGISPELACGKLGGVNLGELDIFVEDDVSEKVLQIGLPHEIRGRIKITHIGSSNAVLHQLSARYLEKNDSCICVLDGDQRNNHNQSKSCVKRYVENQFRDSEEEINSWIDSRLCYLPSNHWPEKWLIDASRQIPDKSYLQDHWNTDDNEIIENGLKNAAQAGKHKEFNTLSEFLHFPLEQVKADIVRFIIVNDPDILNEIKENILNLLDE